MSNKNVNKGKDLNAIKLKDMFYNLIGNQNDEVERDDIAVRGHVGKIIDSVYINETKKTTTVKFADGTVQTVTCHENDVFDPVIGVAIAVSSYVFGSKKNFHDVVNRKIKASTKSKK